MLPETARPLPAPAANSPKAHPSPGVMMLLGVAELPPVLLDERWP
ncbi:hypothetical protein [Rhodocaloribacter sp.]